MLLEIGTNGVAMSDEQWGPWIEHDGSGCPCVGQYVQVKFDDDRPDVFGFSYGVLDETSGWLLENACRVAVFIRYRIRKPKGLTILQDILREVERVDEMV